MTITYFYIGYKYCFMTNDIINVNKSIITIHIHTWLCENPCKANIVDGTLILVCTVLPVSLKEVIR